MIRGINDTPEQAQLLAKRALAVGAHINLIPLNDVEEYKFKPSEQSTTDVFRKILEKNGVLS